MRKPTILLILLVVSLTMLACSVTFQDGFETIETVEESVIVAPQNNTTTTQLTLEFGAGRMFLLSGTDQLLEGTATYNVAQLEPKVDIKSNRVKVYQGNADYVFGGWPNLDELENTWEFRLGSEPLDLVINSGAFTGEFDLGGLALETIEINDGASDVEVEFSELNTVVMQAFEYKTGASRVSLDKLANANMENLRFECGAGSYNLDFSGDLQRDLDVRINASAATITLTIPEGVNVYLEIDGTAYKVYANDEWITDGGGEYFLEGSGPTITINVDLSAGSLVLEN